MARRETAVGSEEAEQLPSAWEQGPPGTRMAEERHGGSRPGGPGANVGRAELGKRGGWRGGWGSERWRLKPGWGGTFWRLKPLVAVWVLWLLLPQCPLSTRLGVKCRAAGIPVPRATPCMPVGTSRHNVNPVQAYGDFQAQCQPQACLWGLATEQVYPFHCSGESQTPGLPCFEAQGWLLGDQVKRGHACGRERPARSSPSESLAGPPRGPVARLGPGQPGRGGQGRGSGRTLPLRGSPARPPSPTPCSRRWRSAGFCVSETKVCVKG